jgi:hypothetical protein
MKKHFLRSCTVLLLGVAPMRVVASGQETLGLEGVWMANVTNVDCQTGAPGNGIIFRALHMFIHGSSLTSEDAFSTPSPRRCFGLDAWRHAQGHMFTSTFWFCRYNPDGSFPSTREVTVTIELNGDQSITMDKIKTRSKLS